MVAIAAANDRMARLKTLRDMASIAVASPQRRSGRWFIQMYLQWPAECSANGPGSSNKRIRPNTVNLDNFEYDRNPSSDGGDSWLEPRRDWVTGHDWQTS